jgi:hypothetical protein
MKNSRIKWALTLSAAAVALVACGGTTSDPVLVATADASVTLNAQNGPTVGAAFVGTSFGFANGVPAFGTSTPTTLAIGGTAAAQTATISAGNATATGDMSYGSCLFVIKTSNFSGDSVLAPGKTVVVNPCEMKVTTAGQVANGGEELKRVTMFLGTEAGSGQVKVTITPEGIVRIGTQQFANLSLTPATGT